MLVHSTLRKLNVPLCHSNQGKTEKVFDCHNWNPGIQHMCGCCMLRCADYNAFPETFQDAPLPAKYIFLDFPNAGNGHVRMCLARKDLGIRLSGSAALLQISFQEDSAGPGNYDSTGLVSLSDNCQFIQVFPYKEVPSFEATDFYWDSLYCVREYGCCLKVPVLCEIGKGCKRRQPAVPCGRQAAAS